MPETTAQGHGGGHGEAGAHGRQRFGTPPWQPPNPAVLFARAAARPVYGPWNSRFEVWRTYGHRVQETFGGIFLDARHRIISEREIFVGTLKSATVSPRDVFRHALSDHAAAVILFHNHPSGDPSPSPQDLAFTTKLVGIGEALGVDILDHLIVTTSSFLSFKQRAFL